MKRHKKQFIGILAALLVLAGLVDATGGRLARPERDLREDRWVGFHLVWERLPGEGEEVTRDGEGWVEYGSQTMDVDGLGSISFPREILIGQYSREEGFTFRGLEGYNAFLAQVEQEDGSTLLTGNTLMHGNTSVGGDKNSISGTIYYGLPLGETAWPEDGPTYAWRAYNVFQMPDSTVYLDGSGNSYGGQGGMAITSERSSTETVNGEEKTTSLSVEVSFEVVSRLKEVGIKQFDASDQIVAETVFGADELEEETAVSLSEEAQWLLVEERCEDGTVKRTVYSTEEVLQAGGLAHTLVILDSRGMGQACILWLGNGEQEV